MLSLSDIVNVKVGIGRGVFEAPGATVIGGKKPSSNLEILKLFANGEQGFWYDPNDLTEEKINWRKNQLLHTDDFTYGASGNYTAVKEADGWALTAIAQTGTGYSLLGVQYPIGAASDSRGAGTVVRSIEVKKGTGVFRFGAASSTAALFVNAATMTAIEPPTGLPYTITAIGSDWYRIETFFYQGSLSSSALSNYFGWSTAKATSSTLDTATQVGAVIRVRKPSFAFVPFESTQSIPYQAITDFNSDFIKQFPLHTLYQDAAGTIPVTAAERPVGLMKDKSGRNNHAYQTTSSMRPLLVASPQRLDYDTVDDKLITNLPAQLTGCTVIRSVPNVGTQILTNQTIPATYEDNKDHCGLIVINRALTPSETSAIAAEFNKRAGV